MKKTFLFVAVALATILWSCSSNDDTAEKQLPFNYETTTGTWYFKSIIKADGTIMDHANYCPKQRDSVVFSEGNRMYLFTHYSCKLFQVDVNCNTLIFNSNTNKISACNDFINGTVSQLTADKMQIDYDKPMDLSYYSDPKDCKSIILTRK
jgi:hypothetical protein